ncbi:hypothetical protein [Sodaliphilus pleomorphus]|uniref:Uncharacterized protein n=1 Tax=Sodaliphilus pleomorphus TaxID=2606626 RepID=A0A6L5XG58_9BACT|nr:hypothetical protein [Sodaliphilus pleomorphus]MSS18484.1 hypothetical protein [Sodaliphilus pleomorphus]
MKTQLVMIYIFTASVAVMAWGGNTIEPVAQVPIAAGVQPLQQPIEMDKICNTDYARNFQRNRGL